VICFGEWGPLELRPISGVGLPRLTQTAFDPALLANRSATVRAAWAGTAIVRHVPGEAQTSGSAAPGREVSGW